MTKVLINSPRPEGATTLGASYGKPDDQKTMYLQAATMARVWESGFFAAFNDEGSAILVFQPEVFLGFQWQ